MIEVIATWTRPLAAAEGRYARVHRDARTGERYYVPFLFDDPANLLVRFQSRLLWARAVPDNRAGLVGKRGFALARYFSLPRGLRP